jgi:hypothetical protein
LSPDRLRSASWFLLGELFLDGSTFLEVAELGEGMADLFGGDAT